MEQRGTALPVVLLVLLAASALAASGFLRAFLDALSTESQVTAVRSFLLAEAGLNEALAREGADTTESHARTYEIDGGTVIVRSRRLLRLSPTRDIRLLTAEGIHRPDRQLSARRTTAQLVLAPLPFRATAALVALDTVRLGSDGEISGLDGSGGECSGKKEIAGLAAPAGGFVGDTSALSGRPPLSSLSMPGAAPSASGVDWTNASSEDFVQPEHLISAAWTSPPAPASDAWPVTIAESSVPTLAESVTGQGTLIVKGDLTIAGALHWTGLVLVAGTLTVPGRLDVAGAVAVGLDSDGAAAAGLSDLSGSIHIRYDRCAVAGAAARLARGSLRRPGGWFEVF